MKRGFLVFFILVLAVLSFWMAGFCWFVRSAESYAVPQNLQKSEAIVVLTGGNKRLDSGLDLLEQGIGEKLFVSGVYPDVKVSELLALWKNGYDSGLECCVELGYEADDTIGNAKETIRWLHREKFRSVILVTANYHMARALFEFRLLDPALEITPYPVSPDGLAFETWWQRPSSKNLIVREFLKYVAARLRFLVAGENFP